MARCAKVFTILLLSLCLFPNEVKAEEMLTWEDCVKEAKEKHPDLVSAREKLNQARSNRAIARSAALPQINSSLSGRTSETDNEEDESDTYSFSVTGRQLLFDAFKTSSNIAAASENIKSSQYNYEVTSSNLRFRLRAAFVALLRAQRLIGITEDIAKRRKQSMELVRLRYEAGREHRGALLTAQANLSRAEFEVAQAKRNISLAQRRLTKELGRTKLTPIRAKGNFEIGYFNREKPDFEGLAENNPLLQELIARKEATRFKLRSTKADYFPEVYASASTGGTASDWPPDSDKWSAGISLSLPLFEGGQRTAAVSKARAALKQAQADERGRQDGIILTLEETWTKLQDAADKVEVQKQFLEAAQERAKIAEVQYSTGLISFDNWIIIEDDLVRAQKSFLDTQANCLVAKANWFQAKGETLDYED